jgi:hypothetical protein
MSTTGTGWPKGRIGWMLGSVLILAAGIVIGLLLSNLVLGIFLAVLFILVWVIAYESWRGRKVGIGDHEDDGAQL